MFKPGVADVTESGSAIHRLEFRDRRVSVFEGTATSSQWIGLGSAVTAVRLYRSWIRTEVPCVGALDQWDSGLEDESEETPRGERRGHGQFRWCATWCADIGSNCLEGTRLENLKTGRHLFQRVNRLLAPRHLYW